MQQRDKLDEMVRQHLCQYLYFCTCKASNAPAAVVRERDKLNEMVGGLVGGREGGWVGIQVCLHMGHTHLYITIDTYIY